MSIESVLARNEAWLKEFDQYAQIQKAPLLYIDMQSPSVNRIFSTLVQKLDAEKRDFMRQKMNMVPDCLAEKEMLQTYHRIIMSESTSLPQEQPQTGVSKYMCFFNRGFPKNVGKIAPLNDIDHINRQLPYYE
jgi:hypothetical protein